jgi:hypothetical protein
MMMIDAEMSPAPEPSHAIARLEQLAAWHRANASHAGSTWIWDARLRTAEDLERQAAALRGRLTREIA